MDGWSENTRAVAEVLPRRQWLVIGYQERTEGEKTDSREPCRGTGKPLCWDRPGVERMTVEDGFCSSLFSAVIETGE